MMRLVAASLAIATAAVTIDAATSATYE